MLSGNRVYSPATAPSITTRSIWIVTFPNEFCHQMIKREPVKMQFNWKSRLIGENTVSTFILGFAFSFHIPSPFCSCSCKKYEAFGPSEGFQRSMQSSRPTPDLDQWKPPDKFTLMRSCIGDKLIKAATNYSRETKRKRESNLWPNCKSDLTIKRNLMKYSFSQCNVVRNATNCSAQPKIVSANMNKKTKEAQSNYLFWPLAYVHA